MKNTRTGLPSGSFITVLKGEPRKNEDGGPCEYGGGGPAEIADSGREQPATENNAAIITHRCGTEEAESITYSSTSGARAPFEALQVIFQHCHASEGDMVRAAVMPDVHAPIEIREFPEPKLEAGSVLLRTLAAEVCGTDVHLWHGRLSGVPYPLIPGHVSVGEVLATGGEVRDIEGRPIVAGQRVTFLDVHETCHNCWYCLVAKESTRCPRRKVYGITYGAESGLLGGWSERIYLKPGVKIVPLAEHVTPELWIAGGCALPTALHAVDRAGIRLGDRVLVQGAGPVGLMACALARLSGARWVGVIDDSELRLAAAQRFGSDYAILNVDPQIPVMDATKGRGADVVIEATGNPKAIPSGCEMARDGGRYVVVGQYTDNGPVELNPHLHINRKHLEIRGCWGSDLSHVWRAMEILSRFRDAFEWTSLISRTYSLEESSQALADVESRRVIKAVILPNGPE
jgi:L-iditol 2-dehydrogenase